MDIDKTGEIDTLIINHTDKEGNDLEPLFEKLRDNGGYLELMTGDFLRAPIAIESQSGDDGIVSTGETTITVNVNPPQFRLHLISNKFWINKISLMFT